ncbi:NAD(P)H-dependent oxidoreductase subunit E [Sphingorhabdus sp.]|uniref:NAD(P)H-dependent oxidoreductase subunit E n=1 Tax=Sphingorhabdus sp. TaxID=1902408 RepID=UPI0039BD6D6C
MTSIADIVAEHAHREGPLLPILHDVQKAFGHVSEDAMRDIAQALNLTRAEVYGVVSFYHDFRKEAEARPILKLCRAEACKARGVDALVPIAENQSRVKLEAVYCLWRGCRCGCFCRGGRGSRTRVQLGHALDGTVGRH